jgi:hypothetical protein
LIDWCLTPTLEVFQLSRGVEKITKNKQPNEQDQTKTKRKIEKKETYLNIDRVSE